jgi:solute:Na+ symporter, SSS family
MSEIKLILWIYLGLVTAIGIYSFFRVKTAADYYISGKRGSWWQVSGSLFATIMGGSAILGTVELSQKAGWAAVWFLTSAALGLFILSLISRKVSILGHYTLPELLLKFYGKPAEKAASLLIPLAWTGIVAAQIIAGAKILSSLGLFSYSGGALVCGLVFIFYTLAGGQLSILKTDFAQALIIIAGIIAMVVLRLMNMEPGESFTGLPSGNMDKSLPVVQGLFNANFKPVDLLFLLLTYSVTFVVGPDIYSRIFCAKNDKVARNSVVIVAFLVVPVAIALTWLGIMAVTHPEAGGGFILPGTSFLPPWALGLIAAALLSAVMSSADTTLLTSSMILAEFFSGNLDKPKSLWLTRIFVILTGIASLLIAIKVTSVLNALLIALSFFSGAFIIPIIAGLAGWPVRQKNAIFAILTGGFLALGGKILNETSGDTTGYWLILAGFVANTPDIDKFQQEKG